MVKQTLVATCAALLLFGCKETTSTAASNDSIPAKMDYAYTIEHDADNWSPGDLKHVQTVLAGLKAYETGDIAGCVKTFGDSVDLKFSGWEAKLSNDSLKAYFTKNRAESKNITIKMDDWESVISKDKKTEFVSLWYKETMTDLKGKTDSMEVMDDLKIAGGKIVSLNEKERHFMAKK
ncbi:MAG: hypothetical protein ABIX01_03505 [Chitinophagaceae bacterium]